MLRCNPGKKKKKRVHFQEKTLIFPLFTTFTRVPVTQSRNAATNTVGTVTVKHFYYKTEQNKKNMSPSVSENREDSRQVHVQFIESYKESWQSLLVFQWGKRHYLIGSINRQFQESNSSLS